jgi:hypothetical protein
MKRLVALVAAATVLALLPAFVSGATDEVFTGTLSGAAEVPPVATTAGGTVYVFINPAGTEIKYAVSYTGLSGPLLAAHIHVGAPGVSGQIMFPLVAGPSTMFGSLTAANFQSTSSAPTFASALAAIRSGNAYINLHTALHPQGEIRAQLKPQAAPAPTPTPQPTAKPTAKPTPKPTAKPTAAPTAKPTARPTAAPTAKPTVKPTPAGTTGATSAAPSHSPPTTATIGEIDRSGSGPNLAIVLLLLTIGIGGGIFATMKVKPTPPGTRSDDD